MGVLYDIHENSKWRDTSSVTMRENIDALVKAGAPRAAHPLIVELHYRKWKRMTDDTPLPLNAS